MGKVNYAAAEENLLVQETSTDFVSENLHEEDAIIQKDIRKRKLTMIGLISVYLVLLIVSLTLLT